MSASLSTCPLCRDQRLERNGAHARCGGCGCRLEFDGAGRKARFAHFPRDYEHMALMLSDRWFTRREMFDAVDAILSAPKSADGVDLLDDQAARGAGVASVGVLSVVVLVLGCLCAAAAAVVALGVFVSNVWLGDGGVPAAVPVAPAAAPAATSDAFETPDASAPPSVPEQPPPAVSQEQEPSEPSAPEQPPAAEPPAAIAPTSAPLSAPPSVPTPVPQPTRARRGAPPTVAAPAAPIEPSAPPTLPPPSPLDSPLPAPPTLPTLPPTFTPPADAAALPTLPPPPPSATPPPPLPPTAPPPASPTPGPAPSATPPYAPGVVRTQGDLTLEIQWAGEDIVVIQNLGVQQVSLTGMRLRALVPNNVVPNLAPNDPRLEFVFPNGATILGNQECKVYTHDLRMSDLCPFEWSAAAGLLWPDVPGKGVTVVLVDADGHEWVRITY